MAELAATLEGLLDRYAADTPAVRAAYGRALELELAFLTAVLPEPGQPRVWDSVAGCEEYGPVRPSAAEEAP